MNKFKIAFWRVWEYSSYFMKGFWTGFGAVNLMFWVWLGGIFTFVGLLSHFVDEDRLVAWIEKHPNLIVFGGLGVAGVTIGGMYWALSTDTDEIRAAVDRRVGRLRLKRVA